MASVDSTPSLTSTPSTLSPKSSTLDTQRTPEFTTPENNTVLEEDATGVLVVPQSNVQTQHHNPVYTCLFDNLDCHDTFDNIVQWKIHIFSHFRTQSPPDFARCPLCPDEKFTDLPSIGRVEVGAWDIMLDHVVTMHYQRGQTLKGCQPDFELMRYLYRLRIINDEQFKKIQLLPPPSSTADHRSGDSVGTSIGSSDEPYCASYSRRRERRLRDRHRGISVA